MLPYTMPYTQYLAIFNAHEQNKHIDGLRFGQRFLNSLVQKIVLPALFHEPDDQKAIQFVLNNFNIIKDDNTVEDL